MKLSGLAVREFLCLLSNGVFGCAYGSILKTASLKHVTSARAPAFIFCEPNHGYDKTRRFFL